MIQIIAFIVTATVYNAVEGQTDDTPLITASNKVINAENPIDHRWIAVSRDLEKLGYTFGTKVLITNEKLNTDGTADYCGVWTVEDRMNKRYKNAIDLLVNNDVKLGKWNVKLKILK